MHGCSTTRWVRTSVGQTFDFSNPPVMGSGYLKKNSESNNCWVLSIWGKMESKTHWFWVFEKIKIKEPPFQLFYKITKNHWVS
jgi:hypothetical protein